LAGALYTQKRVAGVLGKLPGATVDFRGSEAAIRVTQRYVWSWVNSGRRRRLLAEALGLTIPDKILAISDEVIE
jgi:hypothetical protein